MDVERALRESLAANDLTLWSASGACVVNVDEATRNLAASLVARGVAPSPDAPEPTTIGGVVHLHGRDVPCADEFVGECVLRAAPAASGDAPSPDAPGLRTKPWLVRLTCCGRADGVYAADSWDEAQSFREAYTSGPGVSGGHVGDTGHDRSAVIEDALAASGDAPREGLDAAWAEAEADLPKGGYIWLEGPYAGPPPIADHGYTAHAHRTKVYEDGSLGSAENLGEGRGPTPAAALRALLASESHPTKEPTDG